MQAFSPADWVGLFTAVTAPRAGAPMTYDTGGQTRSRNIVAAA
jgi:hypothetical protein